MEVVSGFRSGTAKGSRENTSQVVSTLELGSLPTTSISMMCSGPSLGS